MKNLMNKVLVVLTVSAVFAGNVEAGQGKKASKNAGKGTALMTRREKIAAEMAAKREEVSNLDFFALVKKFGEDNFGLWTREERVDALKAHYGSLDKAPKNLKLFLIGDEKNQASEFRAKYRDAALKELATSSVKEATDKVKKSTEEVENATTPEEKEEAQQEAAQDAGYLASLMATAKNYLTPAVITGAKAAIGAAVVVGATYAVDAAADYAGMGQGWGASARGLVTGPLGEAYQQLKTGYGMLPNRPTFLGGAAPVVPKP